MKKLILLFIACCVSLGLSHAAFGMSSANYVLYPDVLSSGGGEGGAANHANASTLGQSSAIGYSTSAGYVNYAGYWAASVQLSRLQVTTAGTGTGSVAPDIGSLVWAGNTGTGYYNDGAVVNLTASPGAGTTFSGWSGGGCSGMGTCSVTLSADQDVTAVFSLNTYTIATSVSMGSGTVACAPNPVNYSTTSTCSITPSTGYQIIGVTVDGSSIGSPSAYPFPNVTSNHTISASFGVITYSLNVSRAGSGAGTVTSTPTGINCGTACSNGFAYGTPVTLTAAATNGSTFTGWGGACTGAGSCFVTMVTTTAVTATFNDTTGPTLQISALPSGSFTNNQTFNINGTVTDNMTFQVLVISGQTVTVQPDHSFSHALFLSSGTNTVTTTATDLAGNQTTDVRVITLDQTAPSLTITAPADNSITNQSVSTVTGTVEAGATLRISLNSGPTTTVFFTGTTYSTTVSFAAGANAIDVTARDVAGNTNTLHRTVIFDGTVPALSVILPPHDTVSTSATVTISGTVSDNLGAVTVLVTVGTSTYAPTVAAGAFSQAVSFPLEGTYAVTITATDGAGNISTVIRNIIYNTGFGDPNNSGGVDAADALLCFRAYLGSTVLTPLQQTRCDVAPLGSDGRPDPNGIVDIGDVILILRRAVGLVSW